MGEFKDKTGRMWNLEISFEDAKRIEASDFSEVYDGPILMLDPEWTVAESKSDEKQEQFSSMLVALATKTQFAVAFAYVLLADEIKADAEFAKYESEDARQAAFCKRLSRASLEELKQAVREAVSDFFPEMATLLTTIAERLETGRRVLREAVNKPLSNLGEKFDQLIKEEEKAVTAKLNAIIDGA